MGTTSKTNSSNMPALAGRVSLCITLPKRGVVPRTSREGQLVSISISVRSRARAGGRACFEARPGTSKAPAKEEFSHATQENTPETVQYTITMLNNKFNTSPTLIGSGWGVRCSSWGLPRG